LSKRVLFHGHFHYTNFDSYQLVAALERPSKRPSN
jgi:hypothetical protein